MSGGYIKKSTMRKHLHYVTLIFFSSTSFSFPVDTNKFISIQQLIEQDEIEPVFRGLGGYSGEHFRASIQNKTSDSLFVWIEAGRRIFSDDSTVQDIFITRHETLAIGPKQKDSVVFRGYCCQASNRAPSVQSTFSFGEMAPTSWVKLANFLHLNQFPDQCVQSAVWVLSDNKPIGSIHHEDQALIQPLKRKVAELLGLEVPWYSVLLKKIDGQLSSNIVETVTGQIKFYLPSNGVVSILIKDQYGMNVCYPIKGEAYGPGEYSYDLKQQVDGWEKGKYTIWVLHDYQYPLKKLSFNI